MRNSNFARFGLGFGVVLGSVLSAGSLLAAPVTSVSDCPSTTSPPSQSNFTINPNSPTSPVFEFSIDKYFPCNLQNYEISNGSYRWNYYYTLSEPTLLHSGELSFEITKNHVNAYGNTGTGNQNYFLVPNSNNSYGIVGNYFQLDAWNYGGNSYTMRQTIGIKINDWTSLVGGRTYGIGLISKRFSQVEKSTDYSMFCQRTNGWGTCVSYGYVETVLRKPITENLDNYVLNFYVPPSTQATIAGTNPLNKMDFDMIGGLQSNAKVFADLTVNSTANYKISLSSSNNGYLKLDLGNGQYSEQEKLEYSAVFDSKPISMTNTPTFDGFTDGPKTKRFEVTLGNVDNSRAGKYKDTITLTISPQ